MTTIEFTDFAKSFLAEGQHAAMLDFEATAQKIAQDTTTPRERIIAGLLLNILDPEQRELLALMLVALLLRRVDELREAKQ